ncbi:hypothetical protein IAU59_003191 [Kwoniella sp. CBS 9459]
MPSHRDSERERERRRSRSRSRDRDRSRERERNRDKDSHSQTHRHRDKERDRRLDSIENDDKDDRRDSLSHRHRSRRRSVSPDLDKRKSKSSRKEREEVASASDEEGLDLAEIGVKEISEDDYFLKSSEFKAWLKEERGKYLDEMSSDSAHKYFRKFVRRWNDGALKLHQYRPPSIGPASSQTGYKWNFSSGAANLAAVREDVARSTHSSVKGGSSALPITSYAPGGPSVGPSMPFPSSSSAGAAAGAGRSIGPTIGPSIPSMADRQYALETSQDESRKERKHRQKEAYERADEYVPRFGGKDGKMEEKRAMNAENRKWRDKGQDQSAGLEVDDSTLMGDGSSFAAALRAREAASARKKDAKEFRMQDQRAANQERLTERRAKENATMDMFKALAKERFG